MIKSINSVIRGIIFWGLLLLPLFYLPKSIIPYEIPKVMFVYVWGCVTALLLLISGVLSRNLQKIGILQWTVLFFLLIAFFTSFTGLDFGKSLMGNFYRRDGLMTLFVMTSIFITLSLSDSGIWLDSAIRGMAWGNLLSAIWAIFQLLFDKGIGFDGFGAGFGQPVFLTGYLLVTTPFVWFEIRKVKPSQLRVVLSVITLLIITTGLAATRSLISIAMLPIAVLGILIIEGRVSWKVSAIVMFVSLISFSAGYLNETRRGKALGGMVYEGRERIFVRAYLAFKERPFWGWGWANFEKAFESSDWPIKVENDVYVDKPHSTVIEIAISSGLVGLAVYVSFIGLILSRLIKRSDLTGKFLLLVMILYLLHSQTNIISINEELVFWLVAAGSIVR